MSREQSQQNIDKQEEAITVAQETSEVSIIPVSTDPEVQNQLCHKELKYVYQKIDKESSLLWSQDNRLVLPNSRRKTEKKEEDSEWKNQTNAQVGYGEITKGAIMNFMNILQNVSDLIGREDEKYLAYPKE